MAMSDDVQGTNPFFDSFFQENYPVLKRWALTISANNRELSEDLLHDVYLRFSQRAESPSDVESMHSYLYATLKNAHTSYLRRLTRTGAVQLSSLEYDNSTGSSITVDPSVKLKADDELRAICFYACSRKSTSISASILILRFIHGYFSAEVARILNRSRNAIEARLSKVRREITYLSVDYRETSFIRSREVPYRRSIREADILAELRETVFNSVQGQCLTSGQLTRAFHRSSSGLDKWELSHLVSCADCLDHVNRRLRMPLLRERHPLDSMGSQDVILGVLESYAKGAAGTGT